MLSILICDCFISVPIDFFWESFVASSVMCVLMGLCVRDMRFNGDIRPQIQEMSHLIVPLDHISCFCETIFVSGCDSLSSYLKLMPVFNNRVQHNGFSWFCVFVCVYCLRRIHHKNHFIHTLRIWSYLSESCTMSLFPTCISRVSPLLTQQNIEGMRLNRTMTTIKPRFTSTIHLYTLLSCLCALKICFMYESNEIVSRICLHHNFWRSIFTLLVYPFINNLSYRGTQNTQEKTIDKDFLIIRMLFTWQRNNFITSCYSLFLSVCSGISSTSNT